jgi:hypothetical protein
MERVQLKDLKTKKEIEKYRQSFIKNTLRRASYRWPFRSVAAQKARLRRGIYECEKCKKEVPNKEKQLDHKEPVVDPKKGFQGWDDYCARLFVEASGFAVLCTACHASKTQAENEQRKKIRSIKKAQTCSLCFGSCLCQKIS